jgi:SAM-dependent methyltransferase
VLNRKRRAASQDEPLGALEYHRRYANEELIKYMPYRSGLDVLSSGCGQGVLLDQLDGRTGSAWGVDWPLPASECLAPKQISVARGERLPFPTGSFDVAFGQEALAGHAWPSLILSELGRVLRPGGWLVLWESRARLHSDAADIALAMRGAGLVLRAQEPFDLLAYPAAVLISRLPALTYTYAAQATIKAMFALDGLLFGSRALCDKSWHLIIAAQKGDLTDG